MNHLTNQGSWVHASFEANEPQGFTFTAKQRGTYSVVISNEDDMNRPTFDFEVNGEHQAKGGLNPKVAFVLEPGNYTAIVTCRGDTHVKVQYWFSPKVVTKGR